MLKLIEKKIIAIIQARMGSTRLKNKMALDLHGFSILEWVVRRVSASDLLSEVWVATSKLPVDDYIEKVSIKLGVNCHRGSESDVLSRFIDVAEITDSSYVLRVCADNPLICPKEIDRLIGFTLDRNPDYAFNHIPALNNGYIDGAGAELIQRDLLLKLKEIDTNVQQKEHVTKYIWDNLDSYDIQFPLAPNEMKISGIRLDIDTGKDLQFMRQLVGKYVEWKDPEDVSLAKLLGYL